MRVLEKRHYGGCKIGWGDEWRGWRSSEVNIGAVSRGQNELIGNFKMAAGDVNSIRR